MASASPKDFPYARPVAEFAIIVVGVLAALAVDNWNDERKDRLLEARYVDALLEDLRKDDAAIASALDGAETFANRGRLLLSAIESRAITASPRDFVTAATTAAYLRFPTYTRATINDLMSTGNLRLIEDDRIRSSISDYYTSAENRGQWNQNWREYQVRLGHMVPDVVPLHFRDAYEYVNAGGPPWAPRELNPSADDANEILEKLIVHPEIKPAIENMVRTQGVHYTYHAIVRDQLRTLIIDLENYRDSL